MMVAIRPLDGNLHVDWIREDAELPLRTGVDGILDPISPCFFVSKAHLSRGPDLDDVGFDQAGTGGARRRAIRARICPNIRPDTATSAIWNVM